MDFSNIKAILEVTTTLPARQAVATAVVEFVEILKQQANDEDATKRATAQGLLAVMAGQALK